MSRDLREIFREYDQYGVVSVLEEGNRRILSFGDGDEQSSMLKGDATALQHEYTRAMLLVLAFTEPRKVLSLGLGAGGLNSCLHERFPDIKQQVVELRPAVITAAQRFFQLPRSRRLEVHQMDAADYLREAASIRFDTIFSDMYGPEGMDEQQIDPQFIERCADRLKANGWLVLNCWREHEGSELINLLSGLFADIRSCTTSEGNWVIYAGKQPCEASASQLRRNLKALERQLGFSLNPSFKRLRNYL
ncbi:Spermidine synthase-like protein [Marinobacterium lacunae]|uniref:Spermidine synthase-like protein n=1 Tax=Marinobacterium lacunae TaxID=1232683 RepID=A0A081FW16_9GAMM|nr:fused MFS/spermidine synthase [Marinobacterium lacunae]KEA62721.1 Spermidine synthase-like protein [Marinobacterium lacunae]MBR9884738.1 methyltransferase [Oceanospirillales bacterium]